MIELTLEQEQQLRRGGWPVRVVTPRTREEFVLVNRELFDRIRQTLEAEDEIADIEAMYPAVSQILDQDESASRESA